MGCADSAANGRESGMLKKMRRRWGLLRFIG
jgi:hypothetical protein